MATEIRTFHLAVSVVATTVLNMHFHVHVVVILFLYPGVGANHGWIKGKSVLTFVM
jgi:hypothetical protein